MIRHIAHNLILFSGLACFLTACGQLVVKKRKLENINLFILFALMGIILLQFYSVVTFKILSYPVIISFHSTIMFIFSPILYFAYYVVAFPEIKPPKKFYLCFIPAAIAFIGDLYLFFLDNHTKQTLVQNFFGNINSPGVTLFKLGASFAILQMLLYHLALIKVLIPALHNNNGRNIILITFIYSICSASSSIIAIPGYIQGNPDFIRYSAIIISISFIFTYLIGIRYPDFLQLLSINVKKTSYSKSLLKGLNTGLLLQELELLMKDKKLFLNEEITLKDIAETLHISQHQLSQLINEKFNVNFNTFINSYRIEFAKSLLIEKPHLTVLTIAYESGFNSKSTFYDAFTKHAGVTPLEYRKNHSLKKHS
ncbi:MAG: Melibiose operon regulatory protein [Spirochaetes bacterium ADurb.Bin218]|jgi:AraC-like DNA-binding protein|nr:AraC family transcriptional regulator [Spirochaetota bacterium]OQA94758.1 MAG: Melibiose operon regulatory protein [Spirochaetes bacterium ADurb.Bin218]HOV09995.1 helix-turn-helix domain-containing protein [Spirochaetota bacterium]HPX92215.1 helix-turn-helix domain-containing protein [Spirochaetota bacterium]HRR49782.1 helix-turn-helix domain-containing protein [Bacteroidales bacterium]